MKELGGAPLWTLARGRSQMRSRWIEVAERPVQTCPAVVESSGRHVSGSLAAS